MALAPLLWLGVLAFHGQSRPATAWAVALVFSVPWFADTAAHWMSPWVTSMTYPVVQALVVGLVLLPTPALWRFVAALAVTLGLGALMEGWGRADVLVRTVAWAGLLVIAWPHRHLRAPLGITFGLGWLAWIAYSILPGWSTWGLFQGFRALGL